MYIKLVKSIGYGKTKLSAFDNALHNAGISNFNLIPLSSVIPPGSKIIISNLKENNDYGDKLYVVISSYSTSIVGKSVWAGLGWVQSEDGSGLFVEHHAHSKEEVEKLIEDSLTDMVKYRKKQFGAINKEVIGATCEKECVCAIVCAIYKQEKW